MRRFVFYLNFGSFFFKALLELRVRFLLCSDFFEISCRKCWISKEERERPWWWVIR